MPGMPKWQKCQVLGMPNCKSAKVLGLMCVGDGTRQKHHGHNVSAFLRCYIMSLVFLAARARGSLSARNAQVPGMPKWRKCPSAGNAKVLKR